MIPGMAAMRAVITPAPSRRNAIAVKFQAGTQKLTASAIHAAVKNATGNETRMGWIGWLLILALLFMSGFMVLPPGQSPCPHFIPVATIISGRKPGKTSTANGNIYRSCNLLSILIFQPLFKKYAFIPRCGKVLLKFKILKGMSDRKNILKIASALNTDAKNVTATVQLLDEGSTVPFISRYRKEMTGSLDEVAIMKIRDEMDRLRTLDGRKETILKTIEEQGKLTDELRVAIMKIRDEMDRLRTLDGRKETILKTI